jgi:hypothetical protein
MEWTPGITSKLAASGMMHIEAERLKTFDHRWPFNSSANLSPTAMAAAGLFFEPHPKTPDRAICFACKNALSNWDVNDHPMEEHKRWYKTCAFVTGSSKNVPILVADRAKTSAPAPSVTTTSASVGAPAAADKIARVLSAPGNEAPKPPPLNSYLQSLGAPVAVAPMTGDSAGDQASSAALAFEAEIVYSVSSSAPSPSKLLDDSFWSTSSLAAVGNDSSNGATAAVSSKQAPSQTSALKPVTAVSKPSTFDNAEEELVVQHNGRRLKKKTATKAIINDPCTANASQAESTSAAVAAKPAVAYCERLGHADAPSKAAAQAPRIFNLASACAETASARADLDALRKSVIVTLDIMQQQLPTFALEQLDNSISQPLMKGLARLERASANIKIAQLNLSSRQTAQIELLKGISAQVERRKSDLNVLPPFTATVEIRWPLPRLMNRHNLPLCRNWSDRSRIAKTTLLKFTNLKRRCVTLRLR